MAGKAIENLRLGASTTAVALADVTTEQLMANMSDEQKAGLAAALVPAPEPGANAEDGAGKEGKDGKAKKAKEPGEEEEEAPGADAADPAHAQFAHGAAAERARMATVFASDDYEGREALANELLAEGSMSAEAIGKILAKTPKGAEGSAEMLATLRSKNPDLGAGGEDDGTGTKASADNHGWGKVYAKAQARQGRKPTR